MEKIYKVRVRLDNRGWDEKISDYDVKRITEKMIELEEGDKINKGKLMIPKTILLPSHQRFSYSLWCYKEDIEVAIQAIRIKIMKEFEEVKKNVEEIEKIWKKKY